VTRGKEKVALVGSNQALNIAVKTVKAINRLTTLNHEIKEKVNSKRSRGFVDSFVR
jgi:ATP-dependent exoDNAse (exonuclease V) alpha subunit